MVPPTSPTCHSVMFLSSHPSVQSSTVTICCYHLRNLETLLSYQSVEFFILFVTYVQAEIFRRASTSKKWSLNDEILMNSPWALRFSDCEAWSVHLIFPYALVTRVHYTTLIMQRSMGGTAVTIWHEVEFVRLPLFKRYICE